MSRRDAAMLATGFVLGLMLAATLPSRADGVAASRPADRTALASFVPLSAAPLTPVHVPSATTPAGPAADGLGVRPEGTAPAVTSPLTATRPVASATSMLAPTAHRSSRNVTGTASWFAYVPGGAAAGPSLRAALGPGWRGTVVSVCAAVCIRVTLSGWMRADRLIDLDYRSWRVACGLPLSRGLCAVTVGRA